jgi:hypothetical protein
MEFLQKDVGALLQDCKDTMEDVLQADESATEEAAEPTLAAATAQNCFELHQATVVSALVQPDALSDGWGKRGREEAEVPGKDSSVAKGTSGLEQIPQNK